MRCPVGNNKANPMWRGNKVIAWGAMHLGSKLGESYGYAYDERGLSLDSLRNMCDGHSLVIGHNIKFDLLYVYRDTNNKIPRVWDTQLAAYILSAQQHQYASLDDLTLEYVGEDALKDDKIKALSCP